MNVLLSIKPTFVERIFNGEKLYEFRKVIFKKDKIDHIYIYSSYPVKKIVGRFEIGGIIEDSPDRLWETCNGSSGLNYQEFFSYFSDKDRGYAIQIKDLVKFESPIEPQEILDNFTAPQSFCYISTPIG